MKNVLLVSVCALLAFASVGSAAQITFSSTDTATAPEAWNTKYGLTGGDAYVWDFSSGRPDYNQAPAHNTNPAYVSNFSWGLNTSSGTGSSGGSGGSGGSGFATQPAGNIHYDLSFNAAKSFNFTALFVDKTYGLGTGLGLGDTALTVRLLDPSKTGSAVDAWHTITVGDLRHGIFLTWAASVAADETIITDIKWADGVTNGDGAAGFFLDNVVDGSPAPEPATMGLMLFGLSAMFARRRNKK